VERQDRFQNEIVIASHVSTRYHAGAVKAAVANAFPDMLGGRLHLWM
jgi:ribonuclease Z